jgi:hypothetical protein
LRFASFVFSPVPAQAQRKLYGRKGASAEKMKEAKRKVFLLDYKRPVLFLMAEAIKNIHNSL